MKKKRVWDPTDFLLRKPTHKQLVQNVLNRSAVNTNGTQNHHCDFGQLSCHTYLLESHSPPSIHTDIPLLPSVSAKTDLWLH